MKNHSDILQNEAHFQDERIKGGFNETRGKFAHVVEPAVENYFSKINNYSAKDILVVGCSTGSVTPLARKGANVIGIDISSEAITVLNTAIQAEGLSKNASAYVMDAEAPEFSANSFDLICCSGVLHHLDIQRSLVNWQNLLKINGRLIMFEPLKWNPFATLYRFFTPSERTADEHPLTPSDFSTIGKYFVNLKITPVNLLTPLSLIFTTFLNFPKIAKSLYLVLCVADDILFRLFPILKYFAWSAIIECERKK